MEKRNEMDILLEILKKLATTPVYKGRVDNEMVHIRYDQILEKIAEKHEPELLAKIKEITKDVDFWWA